jgi:nicotinic acid phosphoribosyltransferase
MTSALQTDGYKFSMAQAGFPLREETFYLSFRKGGWQYIPFDLEAEIEKMIPDFRKKVPEFPLKHEQDYLADNGYELTPAMRDAFMDDVRINAAPAGTWVYEREPIATITGASFLVSWLEPLVLRLFYPIQLATELKKHASDSTPPHRIGWKP